MRKLSRILRSFLWGSNNTRSPKENEELETLQKLANHHLRESHHVQAEEIYSKIHNIYPRSSVGYVGLSFCLLEQGKSKNAQSILEKAVLIFPDDFDIRFMLAEIAGQGDSSTETIQKLHDALTINPSVDVLHTKLARAYLKEGQWDLFHRTIDDGLEKFPGNSELNYFKGNFEFENGFNEAAIFYYSKVAFDDPVYSYALANIGVCKAQLGKVSDAIGALEAAIKLKDDIPSWHSNLLLAYQQHGVLGKSELYECHKRFAEKFEAPLISAWPSHATQQTGDRLKIGYVSGDFRDHSLAFFIEPVLQNHDHSKFSIYCYSNHRIIDEVTERLKSFAEQWRQCERLDDEQLSKLIREDGIDILIDLSGHTGHNRLLTFARKPARLQATWIGYQATTGLSSIDYRITDASMDPVGATEQFHSERLMRIKSAAWFQPHKNSPDINELPAISNGYITFCCFNNPAKINGEVISTWAAIILACKKSRLIIGNITETAKTHLAENFSALGVSSDRIIFLQKKPVLQFLAMHHAVDIQLDTFPYSGGTTTFHSVWMGVPVLTLEGNSPISRSSASIMRGLDREDFIASSVEQYIEIAAHLTEKIDHLTIIRNELRLKFQKSIVQNSQEFTKSLEDELVQAYYSAQRSIK